MMDLIVDWLSTYALHSTVFLGAVYLLERARVLVELDVRENGWRAAMLAPIVTAALQIAYVSEATPQATAFPQSQLHVDAPSPVSPHTAVAVDVSTENALTSTVHTSQPRVSRNPSVAAEAANSLQIPVSVPKQVIAVVWLMVGGLAVGLLTWQFLALRRRFSASGPCRDRNLVAEAVELANRAGVHIDAIKQFDGASTALVIPPATLCVPNWVVTELEPAHRRAMIAHEVAHLARRDPWWRLVYRAIARILFLQPLNWLALRRLDEIAELACDEWAAAAADRRDLMECLIACGERIAVKQPQLASAMARSRSTLVERVRSLLQRPTRRPLRVRVASGALLVLSGCVLCMPMLVFQNAAIAAPQFDVTKWFAANDAESWSVDDMRGSGTQVRSKSGFAKLGRRVTTMKVNVPGGVLGARIEGDVKFSAAEDSVVAIDGSMVIEEKKDSNFSRVEVEEVSGAIQHRYRVNEKERAFEPEGRQFLARSVPVLLRETAFDADARIERLLQRGVPAVISEVELMNSVFTRRIYLSKLVAQRQLEGTQLTRVLELTGAVDSDFERRLILNAILEKQTLDNTHATKILELVASMGSDFEQRLVLTKVSGKLVLDGKVDPAVVAAWSKAIDTVGSDFEARLVIGEMAKKDKLDPALAEASLRAVGNIDSDFEARLALTALAPQVARTPSLAAAYVTGSEDIDSDFEKRLALTRLIRTVEFDTALFKAVVGATGNIDSKFECQGVLRALLERLPADQESIDLYRRASNRCDHA